VSRATFYRRTRPETGQQQPRRRPPARALEPREREAVREVLYALRFADRSPAEIVAPLLDEKKYLCSERTMYRVLAQEGASRERRPQLQHPTYTKPELVATAPDEVWTWDITKLLGPQKWVYYYLYVILDLFGRYVVGWMVAEKENASLASRLI
jgi:putative transposase